MANMCYQSEATVTHTILAILDRFCCSTFVYMMKFHHIINQEVSEKHFLFVGGPFVDVKRKI
jgi:hypothetical protein